MSQPTTITWDVSTRTLPDAFERYLVGMADLYEVSGVSDHDRRNFFNATRSTLTEAGLLGRGRSVRQTLARSPATLRRSDVDGLNLLINQTAVVGDCDGVTVRAPPGAVQIRDLGRPAASRLDVDVMTLLIPRVLAPPRLLSREMHGLVLDPATPGARLVEMQMRGLANVAPELEEAELITAIQALLLVLTRIAGGEAAIVGSELTALQGTVRRAAADYVETRARAGETPIDVGAVARAAGVSRATLYRAFDGEGGVTRFIQDRRLHHARSALRRRQDARPTISEIAHNFGFASPNHFSRLFRARFGYSPSEVEPASVPTGVAMTEGPIRHDILVDWLKSF